MGKPLSRPDCLRQNPSCVAKGEEEDLNIDDCYVPQRSIYDTVRLNEQIDSGSKGSLASRHFIGTLPYSHRTVDISAFCGNSVLSSSSASELRSKDTARMDERLTFDGLKLNGDIIRGADSALCKPRPVGEKKEQPHQRRSWRTFAPANPCEYGSGTLCDDGTGQRGLGRAGRGSSMTNSLTSEGDSGLCSPTAEREQRNQRAQRRTVTGTRSLSSTEGVHVSGELNAGCSLSSGQEEFPFLPVQDLLPTAQFYTDSFMLGSRPHNGNSNLSAAQVAVGNCPVINGRTFAESSSMTQNSTYEMKSRTFSGYDELPTAELLEDACSQDDCELFSVVVTQPKTLPRNKQNPKQHVMKDEKCYEYDQRATDSRMADLEDFLLLVEREAGLTNGIKHVDDEEIERLLTSISECSQMELVTLPSTQVPQNRRMNVDGLISVSGEFGLHRSPVIRLGDC